MSEAEVELSSLYKDLGVNLSLTLIGPPHTPVRSGASPGREDLTPLQPGLVEDVLL